MGPGQVARESAGREWGRRNLSRRLCTSASLRLHVRLCARPCAGIHTCEPVSTPVSLCPHL
eukprot:366347-Chlamydomonas_euryale.AAC.1